jgi:hypothetical protein
MFKQPKWWVPLLLILLISVAGVTYSLMNGGGFGPDKKDRQQWEQQQHTGTAPNGDFRRERDGRGGVAGLFNTMGQISIYGGAFAFSWLMMKRMMKTKYAPLKWAAKKTYKLHEWIGWIILALALAHSVYFLFTKFSSNRTWDGIAAIVPLIVLSLYGWVMKKSRNKPIMRKIHLVLAIAFFAALLIHAGGTMVLTLFFMGLAWLGVYMVERFKRPNMT